ncbi:DUF6689 family protein [Dokdonella fugitiva]|uniref:DUF6689 family protein n=1 Tax=Dokdonella fugitiva TaxID=328517 RepID=UPI0015F86401|nr:DUF6689 family protein [Dokdonella fugitiva]MBA8884530.1 hypothetical protein [Dokdonella fugitiva]
MRPLRLPACALLLSALLGAHVAHAQVDVEVIGDTAHATILLEDALGTHYDAEVTIVFDTPTNLSPRSLNLSAELFDPAHPPGALPAGVAIDPAFPMLVTIEPPGTPELFTSGFEPFEDGTGVLSFHNTYDIEVHTHRLAYTPNSPYRLLKAPIGGTFADVTEDVLSGSARARGRGGAFSQFIVAKDANTGLVAVLVVILPKSTALTLRLTAAILGNLLRGELTALLTNVIAAIGTAVLDPVLGCTNALGPLDDFIADVEAHAGIDIANLWRGQRDMVNDAGELSSLARTLRFSLLRCAGGA